MVLTSLPSGLARLTNSVGREVRSGCPRISACKLLRHFVPNYKFDRGGNTVPFQQPLACARSQQKIMASIFYSVLLFCERNSTLWQNLSTVNTATHNATFISKWCSVQLALGLKFVTVSRGLLEERMKKFYKAEWSHQFEKNVAHLALYPSSLMYV